MKTTRVLVVDDHGLFRKGVVSLLRATEGFTVVGEAQDGRDAVAKTKALAPDVVLMDVYMPVMNGLEATRLIKAAMPATKVIMLTVSEEDDKLFEAVKAGAHGYLLKRVEPAELFRTVRGVMLGDAFVTPTMAAKILDEFSRQASAPSVAPSSGLSPRERQVRELLTRGKVNKEIAADLEISGNTVKNHLKHIMEKLHVDNRVQAVAYALREGLVRRTEPR